VTYRLTVNGVSAEVEAPGMRRLLDVLREDLGLTGTKEGCGEGECGACTILVDGASVNACLMFAADCDGRDVTTIEGLAADPRAERLRQSFAAHGAVQCGFCTPGMMIQATRILAQHPHPDRATIQRGLEGNLCRCTGYAKIIDAVAAAADQA